MPEAAKGTSKKAAKAFVRHYVDVINHAMATGETQALAKASDSQCSSCNSVIERVTKLYSQGGSIKSNGWRVKTLSVLPDRPVDRPGLDVVLRLTPQVVTESRGEEPKTYNGGKLPTTFFLRLKHHHWIVDDWERAA